MCDHNVESDDSCCVKLASWIARDDEILDTGASPLCVTDGFIRRWRETEVSKMLWADNYEHDFLFGLGRIGSATTAESQYKWVDVTN